MIHIEARASQEPQQLSGGTWSNTQEVLPHNQTVFDRWAAESIAQLEARHVGSQVRAFRQV